LLDSVTLLWHNPVIVEKCSRCPLRQSCGGGGTGCAHGAPRL